MVNSDNIGFARVRVNSDSAHGSSPTPPCDNSDAKRSHRLFLASAEAFLQERLQWLVFSGDYQERRYITALQGYRDTILVDSTEKSAIKQLKDIIKYCRNELDELLWVSLKKSSAGVRLFVELEEGTAFGRYWFLITSVHLSLQPDGLQLGLRCLRPVAASDLSDSVSEPASSPASEAASGGVSGNYSPMNALMSDILKWLPWREMAVLMKQVFSVRSLRELAQFVCMSTLLFVSSLRHLGSWLLQFIDSSGLLVERCTPLVNSAMIFVLKLFGGAMFVLVLIVEELVRRFLPGWRSGSGGDHGERAQQISTRNGDRPLPPHYDSANSYDSRCVPPLGAAARTNNVYFTNIRMNKLVLPVRQRVGTAQSVDTTALTGRISELK